MPACPLLVPLTSCQSCTAKYTASVSNHSLIIVVSLLLITFTQDFSENMSIKTEPIITKLKKKHLQSPPCATEPRPLHASTPPAHATPSGLAAPSAVPR